MSSVAEAPIGTFAAIHILSRGNDGQYLDYHGAFERWMQKAHGYSFKRTSEGFRFVKGRGDDQAVLPGDRISTLPVKAYLLSFLEEWPRGEPGQDVFRLFQRPDLADSELVEELATNPDLLVDGSVAGLLLLPLEECLGHLIANLRNGSLQSWGRPNDPNPTGIRLHEPIPNAAYMGAPLLDWIEGSLGARGYERWEGCHVFPDPPLYINVQFEQAEIEALRSTLVEQKRADHLATFPPEERGEAAELWLASGELPSPTATMRDAKSGKVNKLIDDAERMFCEMYACNGVQLSENRVRKKDAFNSIKKVFSSLNFYQFDMFIWRKHAPKEWKKPGHLKEV